MTSVQSGGLTLLTDFTGLRERNKGSEKKTEGKRTGSGDRGISKKFSRSGKLSHIETANRYR